MKYFIRLSPDPTTVNQSELTFELEVVLLLHHHSNVKSVRQRNLHSGSKNTMRGQIQLIRLQPCSSNFTRVEYFFAVEHSYMQKQDLLKMNNMFL